MTQWKCHHGFTLSQQCRECDLVSAREIESHWGVDEARAKIAQAEAVKTDAEVRA
jgi:hypothetical protein